MLYFVFISLFLLSHPILCIPIFLHRANRRLHELNIWGRVRTVLGMGGLRPHTVCVCLCESVCGSWHLIPGSRSYRISSSFKAKLLDLCTLQVPSYLFFADYLWFCSTFSASNQLLVSDDLFAAFLLLLFILSRSPISGQYSWGGNLSLPLISPGVPRTRCLYPCLCAHHYLCICKQKKEHKYEHISAMLCIRGVSVC